MFRCTIALCLIAFSVLSFHGAAADDLKAGVRGLATRAPADMKIDGDLSEFEGAFCTPVNYFFQAEKQPLIKDRAAQFFYMWDDTAFYAGLRTLDTLCGEPYLSVDDHHHGLLLHSVYHWPNGWDHVPPGGRVPRGESSQWGDYHLREVALYVRRLATDAPYLTFFGPGGAAERA
jgi:hypothetical protein